MGNTENDMEEVVAVSENETAEQCIARLRKENAELKTAGEQLRKESDQLRNESNEIRKHNADLKSLQADLVCKLNDLQRQVDYWRQRFFGRSSEKKHLPLDPDALQPSLFGDEELSQLTPEQKQEIEDKAEKEDTATARRIKPKEKAARRSLDTTGLPVEETHLYPEGTTDADGRLKDGYVEIGTSDCERLERIPGKTYISRVVRHKVIPRQEMEKNPEERTILTPPMPRVPNKYGMAGASLLTDIVLLKFFYHLPFYRIIEQYREDGLRVPASTMNGWFETAVDSLFLLYKLLKNKVLASELIQVDESVVPVIDNEKHRARKGYMWVVRDVLTGAVIFWYDTGARTKEAARKLLADYLGVFQTDGYPVYDEFCEKNGVAGAACWAHVRRKFVAALNSDKALATQAIVQIRELYKVEKEADDLGLAPEQRKEKRQKESYPAIQTFEKWCLDTYPKVLPKSPVGEAIAYAYSLMDRLALYCTDGRINIDNNLIENAVRPLALGRKNWLFCGNDAAAIRAAIVYSMISSCRAAGIDARAWMEDVLVQIPYRQENDLPLDDLLPHEYALRPGVKKWTVTDPAPKYAEQDI